MMLKAGVEADIFSYSTMIKACAEACDAARAEHWLSMTLNGGVEINNISYTTMIKACAEARDLARAEH